MSHVPRGYRKGRGDEGLTDREREVLRRLARGDTTVEVGQALGLSKQRIHQLLNVLDRLGYVVRAGGKVGITAAGLRAAGLPPRA